MKGRGTVRQRNLADLQRLQDLVRVTAAIVNKRMVGPRYRYETMAQLLGIMKLANRIKNRRK